MVVRAYSDAACRWCGAEISQTGHGRPRLYCCLECGVFARRSAKRAAKLADIGPRVCKHCGAAIFENKRMDAQYCSNKCMNDAHNVRYAKSHVKEKSEYDRRYRVKNAERLSAYRIEHRDELRERSARYNAEHKAERAEYSARYRKRRPEVKRASQHRRRVRQAMGPQHTAADELHIYALSGGMCIYCGKRTPWDRGQIEHIVPLSRGGNNGIGNLAWSCPSCNSSKKALLIVEWKYSKGARRKCQQSVG